MEMMPSRGLEVVLLVFLSAGCAPRALRVEVGDSRDDGGELSDAGVPSDRRDRDDAGGPSSPCAAGDETVVRGTVTFPSGALPVAAALVYVPRGGPDAAHGGACGECLDEGALVAHAETRSDGTFELVGLPAGTNTLVVEKGHFRRESRVDVAACEDNVLPAETLRLPASEREGDVPRIAVVTGYFDHMEDVLARLGLAGDTLALFAGEDSPYFGGGLAGAEPVSALLRDPARLATFDIVFVNCGALAWDERGPSALTVDADVSANLRAFVDDGGRLYVTDLSYDLLERGFPSFIDYHGAGLGLGDAPETAGAADFGDDIAALRATVEDEALRRWLAATGDGDGDGDGITVQGLLQGWAMIDAVDGRRTRVWVRAEPPERGRPLTVTFEAGCGRALFSSYHTVSEAVSEADSEEDGPIGAWTAQEKILAYLVLEIGVCITEPQVF